LFAQSEVGKVNGSEDNCYQAVPRDEYFGREDVCTGPLGVIGLGGDAERGSCPGQADNGDRHDDGGDYPTERHPQAAEDDPEQVEKEGR
jgi:hypothetical protein